MRFGSKRFSRSKHSRCKHSRCKHSRSRYWHNQNPNNQPLLAGLVLDERGSAISEFVLIATPLFLPALLFFNALHNTASEEMNASMLARQAVRAFATAPDLATGHQRVKIILDQFAKLEASGGSSGPTSQKRNEFTYNIKCFAENCLTPGSLVELELYRKVEPIVGFEVSKNRKASAVARSYVDKWRDAPR